MDRPSPGPRAAAPSVRASAARAAGLAVVLAGLPSLTADASAARTASASFGVLGVRTVHATATTSGVPGGERIVLEGRAGGRRSAIRDRSTVRDGVARLRWSFPKGGAALHLRVRVVRGRGRTVRTLASSPWRVLRTGGLRPGRRLADVAAGDVVSAPLPGHRGDLVVRGRPTLAAGDAIALAVGRASPDGLLVRVRSVRRAGSTTVARVAPATLPDVMPVGDLTLAAAAEDPAVVRTASKVAQVTRTLACDGGFPATIAGRASLSTGISLRTAWRASSSLERPNVTADLRADVRASVDAGITTTGEGACVLAGQPMFPAPVRLRRVETSIGPLPVTLTVDGQAVLSGSASALGHIATAARGGTRATVRFGYDGLRPTVRGRLTTRLRPHDTAVEASGGGQAGVTPTVDVRLFGLAGPQVDLGAGLRTTADILRSANEPWWTTTAPAELGATFALKALRADLEAPRARLDGHDDRIAAATRPPGGSSASPVVPAPAPLPDGVRARVVWDSAAEVDPHAWNAAGDHFSERALRAIPGVTLVRPDGLAGPGGDVRDADPARPLTIGICLSSGTEAAVAVDLREPDGTTVRHPFVLRGIGGAALVGVTPGSAAPYAPPTGWCGRADGDPATPGQTTTGVLPAALPRSVFGVSGAFRAPVRQTEGVTTDTQVR